GELARTIGKQAFGVEPGDVSDLALTFETGGPQGVEIGRCEPGCAVLVRKGEEHGKIVILAQQAGELLGFGGARADALRPAAAEELHVSPVCLRGFAPAVEGLVAFGLVGLAEGASRLA